MRFPFDRPQPAATTGHMEISLRTLQQLFNSLDPSPFYDRDLDAHAEAFLVGWAQELPADAPLSLTVHVHEVPSEPHQLDGAAGAIRRYFATRAEGKAGELSLLLRQGRMSLAIGLAFLSLCMVLSHWLSIWIAQAVMVSLLREGLTVAGWVAMWRPMQIYLYDWWPLRRQKRLLQRLGAMPVDILLRSTGATAVVAPNQVLQTA